MMRRGEETDKCAILNFLFPAWLFYGNETFKKSGIAVTFFFGCFIRLGLLIIMTFEKMIDVGF